MCPRKLRHIGFPSGAAQSITLATEVHSLARYSKRTLQLHKAAACYPYWISGLFTACYGYFSTFPHGTSTLSVYDGYLGLGVDGPQLPARYPTNRTQDTSTPCVSSFTGLSPSMIYLSRQVQIGTRQLKEGPTTPHLCVPFGTRFSLPSSVFARCY